MDWNTKLFYRINSLVGRYKWLDIFGRAGAEYVIFGVFGWYISAVLIKESNRQIAFIELAFLGLTLFLGWGISQFIGLVVKERRPIVLHPEIRILFSPISNWKAFPSDHTLFVFIAFFLALIFGLPGAWALLPLALWVSWGRVYCGVHYPVDIIGGTALASLLSVAVWFSYLLIF